MKLTSLCLSVALATAGLAAPATAQAPPPDGDWLAFETEHFRVTFQADLEPVARQAARVAEGSYRVLSRELADPPSGMIDLVVTDHVDYSNGYATPFPSNRIVVFARPATTSPQFFARDWMELVVAHELVHIFHLDRTGEVGLLARTFFGRLPVFWPIFPVAATPAWSTEGLATYYESRLTGAGRVHASIHDMIIRTAALEDRLPALDEISAPNPVWPGGSRSYIYGARLMQYITDEYGPEVHRGIVDANAGSLGPTFLLFDHVSREATGKPFDVLYDEWRGRALDHADDVARRVRERPVTALEPVAGVGPYAASPRGSPDGRRLAFTAHDYRSDPAIRIMDRTTGEAVTLTRRNQFGSLFGPAAWLPDGSGLVMAQLEFQGPYRTFSDLWRVDLQGRETRLTHGLRLAQPDVAPDGRRVAAVQTHAGGIRLVVHDLRTGATQAVLEAGPGEAFDRPRWSPDGHRVALSRYAGGAMDLVLVEPATGEVIPVTEDAALDQAPAWTPDGRWLLWWSDRTGIPNIMAVAVENGRPSGSVKQVTNVVTGVVDPEVSPDGRTLWVSTYHHDGWRIASLAMEPEAWWDAPPSQITLAPALLEGAPGAEGAAALSYSPWATLRPFAWIPAIETVGTSFGEIRFWGARLEGEDLIGRHAWQGAASADLATGRVQGDLSWTYRGLGNPVLRGAVGHEWLNAGWVHEPSTSYFETVLAVRDEAALSATVLRRRWRSSAAITLTADWERLAYEALESTDAALADRGITLPATRAAAGLELAPAFTNVRVHPFSIGPEDGISVRTGVGHWWDLTTGGRAYDGLTGRGAAYLGVPLWGYANHVLALRGTGVTRSGPRPPLRNVGGVGVTDVVSAGTDFGSSSPVRGFGQGARRGTRAWSAAAEWRFPLHLRNAPARVLGFSLTALSGTVFADAGDAWCPAGSLDPDRRALCSAAADEPLASAGLELNVDFGLYHNTRARLILGAAQPLQGPETDVVFYLGAGF